MSKDILYIGTDGTGHTELGGKKLSWSGGASCWWYGNDSSSLSEHMTEILKKILNLDAWPKMGELLVYDINKEEGYIVSHDDL